MMNYNLPVINMEKTGERITALRRERGISVKQLQTIFEFGTPQAIYKWQHGAALPSLDNLVILADVLGVSVDEIIVIDYVNGYSA